MKLEIVYPTESSTLLPMSPKHEMSAEYDSPEYESLAHASPKRNASHLPMPTLALTLRDSDDVFAATGAAANTRNIRPLPRLPFESDDEEEVEDAALRSTSGICSRAESQSGPTAAQSATARTAHAQAARRGRQRYGPRLFATRPCFRLCSQSLISPTPELQSDDASSTTPTWPTGRPTECIHETLESIVKLNFKYSATLKVNGTELVTYIGGEPVR